MEYDAKGREILGTAFDPMNPTKHQLLFVWKFKAHPEEFVALDGHRTKTRRETFDPISCSLPLE
jgi:hypothetical protein